MLPLGDIFRLLVLALELWVQRESRREIRQLEEDEKEILRLRQLGDPASQLSADRLRARVTRGIGIVSRVDAKPAASSSSGERKAGDDKGRSVDSVAG